MTTDFKTIDIEKFANGIKTSALRDTEVKSFQSLASVADYSTLTEVRVFVTVVSVCFDGSNVKTPNEQVTLIRSMYEIFNCCHCCRDVQSVGNHVLAIFDTPLKTDIDSVLDSVGMVNALFGLVNRIHQKTGDGKIKKGVGMIYGNVLMSVLSQEPVINVSWSGSVVQKVLEYSNNAKSEESLVYISYSIFNNLKESYQKLFVKDLYDERYHGQPVNIAMNKWNQSNV